MTHPLHDIAKAMTPMLIAIHSCLIAGRTAKIINANLRNNSTFANGEVKEVRELKAICFTDRYSTKMAVGYNF